MSGLASVSEWEQLLAAERHIQALIPGTVLVGGTAAAIHAGHRQSIDGDHVLGDLRERFDQVLLRRRIHRIVLRVPLPLAHFWLAALESLGEVVDYDRALPRYAEQSSV